MFSLLILVIKMQFVCLYSNFEQFCAKPPHYFAVGDDCNRSLHSGVYVKVQWVCGVWTKGSWLFGGNVGECVLADGGRFVRVM